MPINKDDGAMKPDTSEVAARQGRKFSTGGNPAFDERRAPQGEKPRRGRVYAGGNPWFDEREAPKKSA